MILSAQNSRPAAALLMAALIMAQACGGDDDGAAPAGTSSPTASGGVPAATIDIGGNTDVTKYAAQDVGDLVNVGVTVALGDFDDDGETDALIGAPQADGPDNDRLDGGEAYVVFGPLDEDRPLGAGSADVAFFGAAPGDGLGSTVASGDLNGDGVDDAIIGAPGVTAGFDPRSDQGRVYVFYGRDDLGDDPERDLAEDIFDLTVTGAEGFSRLGHAIALGDVNGDGNQDLITGAPFAGRVAGSPPGGERTALGEVYVIYGVDGLSGERNVARDEFDVLISGGVAFGQFGSSVGVGDVNGDGLGDIVVGAYRGAAGGSQDSTTGAAYVFNGGARMKQRLSVEDGDQDATIVGPASSSFGFPLIVADFNGDTLADMAVGAQLQTSGLLDRQGAVHVILGSEDIAGELEAGSVTTLTITGSITGEIFPSGLAAADIDGDGAADLVAGSILAGPADRPGSGIVHVFTGLSSAESTIDLSEAAAAVTILGAENDDRLGGAVAGGPLDGDQRGLLLVASQAETDSSDPNTGVVYVVPVTR
ncbi:MAG TPA: hypothetical protein VFP63_05525 [Dehalococcoidia bacterium]|nr:hypothetical protein [Dehalococcoidia bacterium]